VGLATRLLNQAQATVLPGSDGGFDPFFSPDGQWIGFFAGGPFSTDTRFGVHPAKWTP
jgi:hypothetical protein